MKRLAVAVIAVVLSAAVAFGAAQDFGAFVIDVPDGWTASVDGTTGIISKADNSGNMSITVDSTDGMSAKDLADAFRAEFAKSFTSVGELEGPNDGDYEWDMTNNGVESHALVSVHESQFMLIVVTGAVTQDEAGAMLSTLQVK